MGLSLLVAVPSLVLTVLAMVLPNAVLGWVNLVVGPAIGVAVLLLGIRWGAQAYDRRAPELLQKVLSYA